jgi:hypothetical protein
LPLTATDLSPPFSSLQGRNRISRQHPVCRRVREAREGRAGDKGISTCFLPSGAKQKSR